MNVEDFTFSIISSTGLFIMCVYLVAGIVDAVCGGGGLFTVPALMSIGMPPHMVIGTNQSSLILGNITAIYKYAKKGKIDFKVALIAMPFTLIGAYLGARLNLLISERYLQLLMLILLPVMALFSFTKKEIGQEDLSDTISNKDKYIKASIIGIVIGTYHAFYGPASGLFFIASFCVFLRYDMLKANGISKMLLFFACLISAITYALSGNVQWQVVMASAFTYIVGNYIGSTIALTKGAKIVKPAFYLMLVVLFIKLISDYFTY